MGLVQEVQPLNNASCRNREERSHGEENINKIALEIIQNKRAQQMGKNKKTCLRALQHEISKCQG